MCIFVCFREISLLSKKVDELHQKIDNVTEKLDAQANGHVGVGAKIPLELSVSGSCQVYDVRFHAWERT